MATHPDQDYHPFVGALGSAKLGEPEGVYQMMFIFAEMCRQVASLGAPNPLPPLILARVSEIAKKCDALSEFADGWARGAKINKPLKCP